MAQIPWQAIMQGVAMMANQPQQQVMAPPPVDNSVMSGKPFQGLEAFRAASNAQIGGIDAAITEPASEKLEEKKPENPFVGFFDRLDNNLQSPSKQIGLGLLGRQDPRLAMAGLIAMGLLGNDSTTNE